MKFKFLGQNGFLINFNNHKLVIDPFISGNPLVGGEIDPTQIECDYILVTHAHGDHVADVELIAKTNDATIIANFEIATHYSELGYKTHAMNHGGKFLFNFGTVKMVNAIHTSTFPDNTHGGNPAGFVVWDDKNCFYIAGDTALTMDMKIIPMTCPKLDVAILPIGDNFTMDFKDAAIASTLIDCDNIIGAHYDTFPVIAIDHEKAKAHFNFHDKQLHLLKINEEYEL
jgi:L-ascorbate metabolism protein UlaG (beta-lactamase superfamily)